MNLTKWSNFSKIENKMETNNTNPIKNAIFSFIFAILLPVIAYGLLKLLNFTDTLALGVATAFPVILTIYSAVKKRKINPIGLVAICGFLISILAVYLSHGNDLAFKLWHPILTGGIGVVLLFSAAIGHPLMALLAKSKRLMEDSEEENPEELKRFFTLITFYMGLIFALHATATIILAFMVPTTNFVFISKGIDIVTIVILIGGFYLMRTTLFTEDEK